MCKFSQNSSQTQLLRNIFSLHFPCRAWDSKFFKTDNSEPESSRIHKTLHKRRSPGPSPCNTCQGCAALAALGSWMPNSFIPWEQVTQIFMSLPLFARQRNSWAGKTWPLCTILSPLDTEKDFRAQNLGLPADCRGTSGEEECVSCKKREILTL